MSPLSLKDYWSNGANAYSLFSGEGGLKPLHEEVRDTVVNIDKAKGRLNILDIACGDGEPSCSLAQRLPLSQVVATDFAPGMVELTQKKAKSLALTNMRFAVADAMDLHTFPDNSMDVVTCVAALFMVPDPAKALQEFKRVLSPGGLLLTTVWSTPENTNVAEAMRVAKARVAPSTAQPQGFGSLDPSRLCSHEGFAEMLVQAGFSEIKIKDFNLVFKFPKDAFRFPDGSMVGHPMLSMVSGQLEAAGVSNPLEKLMKETEAVFSEQGFVRDHSFVFPRNVAVIATAIA